MVRKETFCMVVNSAAQVLLVQYRGNASHMRSTARPSFLGTSAFQFSFHSYRSHAVLQAETLVGAYKALFQAGNRPIRSMDSALAN